MFCIIDLGDSFVAWRSLGWKEIDKGHSCDHYYYYYYDYCYSSCCCCYYYYYCRDDDFVSFAGMED